MAYKIREIDTDELINISRHILKRELSEIRQNKKIATVDELTKLIRMVRDLKQMEIDEAKTIDLEAYQKELIRKCESVANEQSSTDNDPTSDEE